MGRKWLWLGALCGLMLAGAGPSEKDEAGKPKDRDAVSRRDAQALAAKIDEFIAAKWSESKVTPSKPADDAEFIRRVHLDIVGKIPAVMDVREFVADTAKDKRERLVDKLLKSPGYTAHYTNIWRALLLPESTADFQIKFQVPNFEAWLRKKLSKNDGYDKMVRELVTAKLGTNSRQGYNPYMAQTTEDPLLFYSAKAGKPENLAASTARLFMGVRIECAQCHDHPFAKWKREEFWGYASFFGGVNKQGPDDQFGPIRELPDRQEMAIPGTDRVVQASFLGGGEPRWKYNVGPRDTLADWLTSPENPYFARAGANRMWAQLLGIGLVDPVDDMGDDNPASHPELLDELARQFASHKFDAKFLIRAITASKAYQLSSAVEPGASSSVDDPRLFAHKAMKGLTAEQLFDSLTEATGVDGGPRNSNPYDQNNARSQFLEKFANQDDKPTEHQTSILHALTLMNGQLLADATTLEKGATLGAVAEATYLDTGARIEALYLAALSRPPRPDELERMVQYVERGGPTKNPKKALTDIFWALLNGSEFLLNH